jgi:hypothetical protein
MAGDQKSVFFVVGGDDVGRGNVADLWNLSFCVGPQKLCAEHDQRCITGRCWSAGTDELFGWLA